MVDKVNNRLSGNLAPRVCEWRQPTARMHAKAKTVPNAASSVHRIQDRPTGRGFTALMCTFLHAYQATAEGPSLMQTAIAYTRAVFSLKGGRWRMEGGPVALSPVLASEAMHARCAYTFMTMGARLALANHGERAWF